MTAPGRRLRVLTWNVHGNYLYYLSHVPHDLWLVTAPGRAGHHVGRGTGGGLPWGANVREVPIDAVAHETFDVVLYQSRATWDDDRHRVLSAAQRRLPRIYVEHDPPQSHPTNQAHWMDDPNTLLVHVTPFNALMWDSGAVPVQVIEHGVALIRPARHRGERPSGLVVVNNLDRRGRRLGADLYDAVAAQVPLSLVGMGSERCGGEGEVANDRLPERMAEHRFYFSPIRYTSLGLSTIEAMMVGVPVVGLATTELSTVIANGRNGFVDTRVDRLVDAMRALIADPALARALGDVGRHTAVERFGIARFVDDWNAALRRVTS